MVIKMNGGTHVIWVRLFSYGQVKYQFTHPDGQAEAKSYGSVQVFTRNEIHPVTHSVL